MAHGSDVRTTALILAVLVFAGCHGKEQAEPSDPVAITAPDGVTPPAESEPEPVEPEIPAVPRSQQLVGHFEFVGAHAGHEVRLGLDYAADGTLIKSTAGTPTSVETCTIESEGAALACELFGAEHAYVQPHSGANANLVAFLECFDTGLAPATQYVRVLDTSSMTLDEVVEAVLKAFAPEG